TVQNTKAYLVRSLKNTCLNYLGSLKKQKEWYFDNPLEQLKSRYEEADFSYFDFDFDYELSEGLKNMLEKLTPSERNMLILKEGFGFSYIELNEIFEKKVAHCRKLLSRAKEKMELQRQRFHLDMDKHRELLEAVKKAYAEGKLQELIQIMQEQSTVEGIIAANSVRTEGIVSKIEVQKTEHKMVENRKSPIFLFFCHRFRSKLSCV
ncbi:MAG: sigma factor-like helix-turn-helix DNA-binding protein, partial [Chitinophagales bacterium]